MILQRQKNGQYMITLPQVIVKALGWKKKDKLEWRINNKSLSLIKK